MKIITKGGAVRIALCILLLVLLIAVLPLSLDFQTRAIMRSPDNRFKAWHVFSRSEAGAAPYGSHVFIAAWWQPLPHVYLEPVFAGYGQLKIQWKSPHVLFVTAEVKQPEDIVVKKTTYNGIQITYNITVTEPQKQDDTLL